MRTKIVCVAAALAALTAAPAYAGSHVSVGFYSGPPLIYNQPPVVYSPAPVYYSPAPVAYYPQPYYVAPQPVYYPTYVTYPRPYYAPSYGYRFSFGDWDHHREHHDWH